MITRKFDKYIEVGNLINILKIKMKENKKNINKHFIKNILKNTKKIS